MIISFISDTHSGRHHNLKLPGGDVLIHAGDISNYGEYSEVNNFLAWFRSIDNYKHKIFIAGNHDVTIEDRQDWAMKAIRKLPKNCIYLENSGVEIKKLKIYGTPDCPQFGNWAFMHKLDLLYKIHELIPDDTDILVSHSPPFGILDINKNGVNCGTSTFAGRAPNAVIHAFGHIHESYGTHEGPDKLFINASIYKTPYDYKDINKPITVELDKNRVVNYSN